VTWGTLDLTALGPRVDAHAKALTACDIVEELWEHDKVAYRAVYADDIRESLSARGVTIAVEFVDTPIDTSEEWAPLLNELHESARRSATQRIVQRVPGHAEASPAEAARLAGRTYAERANAVAYTDQAVRGGMGLGR